ncbi:centromere protein T isoform X4 [Lathamus discolor]|uniref:centromere protein T isoform X4 n=1 Tax=Lathamus discolor TaxID=678569 RepID=UPI0032B7AF59
MSARGFMTGAAAVSARRSSSRRSSAGATGVRARRSSAGETGVRARRSSSRRSTTGAAAETRSNPGKKNLGRSTLVGLGPQLSDTTDDTPRTLIKKIIHIFPPASPVVPDISKHEEPEVAAEEAQPELSTGRLSNTEEMQLPELVPEERAVFIPRINKETKQLKISEFERAVSQQLVQNQAPSLLDSTVAGSLSMSLGSLVKPDTVERRHLHRRPKNRKPVDIKVFEDKVEQDMLRRKEAAPSEEEGIVEGGIEYQGSPEAGNLEHEIAQDIGAGSLSKHSNPTFSEKSGMEPLKDAVEQADELEDPAILIGLDSLEEEPTEDEAGDPENKQDLMKAPPFVHAAASRPPLLTPSLAKPAAPEPPLQPQQAKPVVKCSWKKPLEPKMSSSSIKSVFKDYAKMPVATESFRIVEKCTKKYFKQLWSDLSAFATHAGRKTVEVSDIEVLMRRQRLVTDEIPLHVLIERHLPLDYRKLLIPVAVSGNKVIPEIKHSSSRRLWKDA